MPHHEVGKIQRARAKQLRRTMTRAETLLWRHLKAHRLAALMAIGQAAEQAGPPSLTLPRKGEGNTSADGAES